MAELAVIEFLEILEDNWNIESLLLIQSCLGCIVPASFCYWLVSVPGVSVLGVLVHGLWGLSIVSKVLFLNCQMIECLSSLLL